MNESNRLLHGKYLYTSSDSPQSFLVSMKSVIIIIITIITICTICSSPSQSLSWRMVMSIHAKIELVSFPVDLNGIPIEGLGHQQVPVCC